MTIKKKLKRFEQKKVKNKTCWKSFRNFFEEKKPEKTRMSKKIEKE